jgi:SpoVK/Ycf46/Vps4 family AAA+-type ATPase
MRTLQELLEKELRNAPRQFLEKRLAEKLKASGLRATKARTRKVAEHILAGNTDDIAIDRKCRDASVFVTDEDLDHVLKDTERFFGEQYESIVRDAAENIADLLYESLAANWPGEYEAQEAEVAAFMGRLERRWGKALAKLRMLLTIAREWTGGAFERWQHAKAAGKTSHLTDVMLRLLVRACQVTDEILVLLENGFADAAMARWRTLHEIAIVSAVIAKYGEEIAERYVYYQIIESWSAIKAYDRDHKNLGFGPIPKRLKEKTRRDYDKAVKRFGKKFKEENGWAADDLKVTEKERITFARLEQEAGEQYMRSPYKLASYNVHSSPKGIYVKLGSLNGPETYLAGRSNAGLIDPGQHAAVSLSQIVQINIGDSLIFDDLVAASIVDRLKFEIPREFGKAHSKLRRDDRQYRKELATGT